MPLPPRSALTSTTDCLHQQKNARYLNAGLNGYGRLSSMARPLRNTRQPPATDSYEQPVTSTRAVDSTELSYNTDKNVVDIDEANYETLVNLVGCKDTVINNAGKAIDLDKEPASSIRSKQTAI
jgi:hypothetical protein